MVNRVPCCTLPFAPMRGRRWRLRGRVASSIASSTLPPYPAVRNHIFTRAQEGSGRGFLQSRTRLAWGQKKQKASDRSGFCQFFVVCCNLIWLRATTSFCLRAVSQRNLSKANGVIAKLPIKARHRHAGLVVGLLWELHCLQAPPAPLLRALI